MRWKWVIGYRGYYKVSDTGEVKSVARRVIQKLGIRKRIGQTTVTYVRRIPGKKLKPNRVNNHYMVRLTKNGKGFDYYVHTLVLSAFKGRRPRGLVCRHLDGDGYNNCVTNLQWGTVKENEEDSRKHGSKCSVSQDTVEDIRSYCEYWKNINQTKVAKFFGVSQSFVSRVVRRLHRKG